MLAPRRGRDFKLRFLEKSRLPKSDDLNIQKRVSVMLFGSGSPGAVLEPKISLRIAAKRIRVQI